MTFGSFLGQEAQSVQFLAFLLQFLKPKLSSDFGPLWNTFRHLKFCLLCLVFTMYLPGTCMTALLLPTSEATDIQTFDM